jgi:hypothetical protein
MLVAHAFFFGGHDHIVLFFLLLGNDEKGVGALSVPLALRMDVRFTPRHCPREAM